MRSVEPTKTPNAVVEEADSTRSGIFVVGLGHVGLSLALAFDRASETVVGYDIDEETVESLSNGTDPVGLHGDEAVAESDVTWEATPAAVASAEAVVVAVPTPVRDGTSDLSAVEAAARTVGERLRPGTTVVLESTVPPGTTERCFVPTLEEASGLTAGEEFRVGYSPARLSPGDQNRGLADVRKVVSGLERGTVDAVESLYEGVVDAGVVRAESVRVAEAAKCLENAQRDLDIALVNEFSAAADAMGIDGEAVIDVASTKWNFHSHHPGIVAGDCLPTDPYHLANAAEGGGGSAELIRTARTVNESVPDRVVEMTRNAATTRRRQIDEAAEDGTATDQRLLVLGLAYKAGTAKVDDRGLAAIVDGLRDRFDVRAFDPRVGDDRIRDVFDVVTLSDRDFGRFDVVLVGAAHPEFHDLDLATVAAEMNDIPVVVDVDCLFERRRDVPVGVLYRRL